MLAPHTEIGNAILAGHALPSLVKLLESGTPPAKVHAAAILKLIAITEVHRKPIAESGAIPHLLKLATKGTSEQQEEGKLALKHLKEHAATEVKEANLVLPPDPPPVLP